MILDISFALTSHIVFFSFCCTVQIRVGTIFSATFDTTGSVRLFCAFFYRSVQMYSTTALFTLYASRGLAPFLAAGTVYV